jgi:hypothetical protein
VFRPGPSQALLARFGTWIDTRTDQVIISGSLILGFWLTADSLYQILTWGSLRSSCRRTEPKGGAVSRRASSDTRKFPSWIATAKQNGKRYQDKLERRPWVAFPLESVRRFNKIEGKHLALVIALNLFVAVIPLMIIGYAFVEAFNPDRDVGNLLAGNLHLTGGTAQIVKDTFANASSGRSVALSISLISLLITGLDVSATAQIAHARAFSMTPLRGAQKYLRGAAWLTLLLAGTGAALTLRSLATPPSARVRAGGWRRAARARVRVLPGHPPATA